MTFDLSAFFSNLETANTVNISSSAVSPRPASHGVSFVSGPCGSGKTYAAAQEIVKTINERPNGAEPNYLYVGPSIRLLTEFAAFLSSLNVNHRIISSETDPNMVTKELMNHLKFFDDTGHVALCTHAAFFNLPYFPKQDQWTVIIDEIPQSMSIFPFL